MNESETVRAHFGTPVQELAKFFHQDYHLFFKRFGDGLRIYAESLNAVEKVKLKSDVEKLLIDFPESNSFAVEWTRQGAQWNPKDINIRDEFCRFVKDI